MMKEFCNIKGLSDEQAQALFPDNLIFLGYRGSIAHGMYVPQNDPMSIDDKDLMGIFIAPIEHYLGFGRFDHKEAFIDEWDVVNYELRKFFNLLLKSNPNVLSLLWLPKKHIVYQHDSAKMLFEKRDIFVSKLAYTSFIHYAQSQLKKMTHFNFDGYMGKKRKELVEQFGYDTKNAAHLIRLLRMGIEFLYNGFMQVERTDAEELLAIKKGQWTLEEVKSEAEELFIKADESYKKSTLPDLPVRDSAEKLLMKMIKKYYEMND